MQYAADSAPYVRAAGKEAPRKKTDRTKRVPGTKMPFGTTKGAFGKEGKGAKGSKGGKPLAKMDCGQERTKRGGEAVFDDAVRRDWVLGYSKRKTQRRKYAEKQAVEKARKERNQERKERREEMKHKLGLDQPEEPKDAVVGSVETEVHEYGNGVVVTVEGLD